MNLIDGPAEYLFPRNVGLMFFNEHPERFFPYTQIDVVHFPDGPGADAFTVSDHVLCSAEHNHCYLQFKIMLS
jgi:hypothetical protein